MRRNTAFAFIAATFLATSCLETAAPTPVSKDFEIVPLQSVVTGSDAGGRTQFFLDFSVRNKSSQQIFIDAQNLFVEKLVDQEWRHVYGPANVPFAPNGSVDAAKSYVFRLDIVNRDSTSLLANVRGVYRIHLGLAFDARGATLLDSTSTYSTPFVVQL